MVSVCSANTSKVCGIDMKITYKENPLDTVVELDEHEKKELWYKIKIDEMEDRLFMAHYYYNKEGGADDVQYYLDPEYYCTDEKSPLDKRCDQMLEWFIEELKGYHNGDCTCVPASCIKCHAERKLGIDTIEGLGKHSAHKIDHAFREHGTIDAVLESLKEFNPKISDVWKNNREGWEEHLPRWKQEAKHAYDWLLKYKEEHGPWT
jgi:hypothetical protein